MPTFFVFHRTFWKDNFSGSWPDGLEPELGEKIEIATVNTIETARILTKDWNDNNAPGRYSDKAEFIEL